MGSSPYARQELARQRTNQPIHVGVCVRIATKGVSLDHNRALPTPEGRVAIIAQFAKFVNRGRFLVPDRDSGTL
jgi:hypothetical protein